MNKLRVFKVSTFFKNYTKIYVNSVTSSFAGFGCQGASLLELRSHERSVHGILARIGRKEVDLLSC